MALPVHRDAGMLDRAVADVCGQTFRELEVLIVLNGADGASRQGAERAAAQDARVRVIELERASLARALNTALREATYDLVARMDADDRCAPERLAIQRGWMAANPRAAAVGTAWDQVDGSGRRLAVIRPPTDPRELRWRLFIENPLAHGSMMMRRSAVRAAGGYDERLERGQDYDLWLRLSRVGWIGAVPEVLYTHRVRDGSGSYCAGAAQAAAAAQVMLREWSSLEPMGPTARSTLAGLLAGAMADRAGAEDGPACLADFLTEHGPSREGLGAYLWAHDRLPPLSRRAIESCRRARLREVGGELRRAGVREVSLWGAGVHGEWIAAHADDLGLRIAGWVDDAGRGRGGVPVRSPDELRPGEHVLIASDAHEERIWERSGAARARGVHVHRLYADAGVTVAG